MASVLFEVDTTPGSVQGSGITLQKIHYLSGTPSNASGTTKAVERLPLIEDQPLIVYVRRFTGETAGIDVDVLATFREDW